MPKLGLTMEVGVIVSWRKKEGDRVEKDEPILEVETDKIVTDVQAPVSGVLLKVLVAPGTEAKVQTVLGVVGEPGEDVSSFLGAQTAETPADSVSASEKAAAPSPSLPEESQRQRITPRARRLLADHGLTPGDLESLGKTRVTEADVQEFIASRGAGGTSIAGSAATPFAEPPSSAGEFRPVGRIEKIVSERMTQSFRDIPQFSVRIVADVGYLLAYVPRMKQSSGASITINDLILRAAAAALSRFPDVQYQFRPEGIYVPSSVGLGFAVALGRELVVPVIHQAEGKTIGEICREAAALVERAKARRLSPEDLSGGTFTVSNLGMYGISSFVPIVNPGEGAILGVGAVQAVPRIHDGGMVPGSAVELTLVCDHRSVNGAAAAEFCRTLKQVLESPQEVAW